MRLLTILPFILHACLAAPLSSSFKKCSINFERTSTGVSLASHSFETVDASAAAQPVQISLDATIKVSCLFDGDSSPSIQYATLIFAASTSSYAVPLRIRKSKQDYALRLEYDLSKAPTELINLSLDSSATQLSLHVASYELSPADQISTPIADLRWAASVADTARQERKAAVESAPEEWHVDRHAPRPSIEWTFKSVETGPPAIVGAVASLFTVAVPLVVLAYALGLIWHKIPFSTTGLSLPTTLFLLLLVAIEGVFLAYWIRLTLFTILPILAGLGPLTAYIGKTALRERYITRTQKQA